MRSHCQENISGGTHIQLNEEFTSVGTNEVHLYRKLKDVPKRPWPSCTFELRKDDGCVGSLLPASAV